MTTDRGLFGPGKGVAWLVGTLLVTAWVTFAMARVVHTRVQELRARERFARLSVMAQRLERANERLHAEVWGRLGQDFHRVARDHWNKDVRVVRIDEAGGGRLALRAPRLE